MLKFFYNNLKISLFLNIYSSIKYRYIVSSLLQRILFKKKVKMSVANEVDIKYRLLDLFSELDDDELESVEKWICSQSYKTDLERKRCLLNSEKKLKKIGESLKKIGTEMPSETIIPPTLGDQSDCNNINTVHVDEFVYDEDDVEKLVRKGELKRHYCVDCNSRNIKDLIYISHSMSRQVLQYIFNVLLPKDLEDKQVLDIGSRLGAVLYGAYYLSNVGTIIGIEMNKEWCEVQEKIIHEFAIDNNKVKIINSDVIERGDILSKADIIIINVLDFFVDSQKQRDLWYFFKKYIKKGSYLVLNRSIADTLVPLDIFEQLMNWLSICKPNQLENEIFFNMEDCCELFLYTVN